MSKDAYQAHIEQCKIWAKKYYNLGLNVIPIKYKSKAPNGFAQGEIKQYHYQRIPEDTFQRWLDENRFENIAILGGHVSQDLVCFDFDNPKDFKALSTTTDEKTVSVTLENLIEDGAWVTATPKEKGRYHVVLRDNKTVKTTRINKNIDYRANEHYWLAYPSIHPEPHDPDKPHYNFLNTHNPENLKLPVEKDTLSIFTAWNNVIENTSENQHHVQTIMKSKKPLDNSPDCIRNAFTDGAKPGMRYDTAIGLSSYLQQKGFPLEMSKSLITHWFTTKCETKGRPLKDIENAAAVGYQKGNHYETGCTFWRNKTRFCPYKNLHECKYYIPKFEFNIGKKMLFFRLHGKNGFQMDDEIGVIYPRTKTNKPWHESDYYRKKIIKKLVTSYKIHQDEAESITNEICIKVQKYLRSKQAAENGPSTDIMDLIDRITQTKVVRNDDENSYSISIDDKVIEMTDNELYDGGRKFCVKYLNKFLTKIILSPEDWDDYILPHILDDTIVITDVVRSEVDSLINKFIDYVNSKAVYDFSEINKRIGHDHSVFYDLQKDVVLISSDFIDNFYDKNKIILKYKVNKQKFANTLHSNSYDYMASQRTHQRITSDSMKCFWMFKPEKIGISASDISKDEPLEDLTDNANLGAYE